MDRMLTWTSDPCASSKPPPPPPPLPLPQTPRMCIMMVESRRAPSQAYWNVAQFINSEYARRHGYRFISVNSADSEIAGIKSGQTGWADRQAGLNRMLAARHWLPSCGSLLYVDSDAFVTNASLSVEAFVDQHCRAACDGDAKCVAFTFIIGKVDFPQHCFLKAAGFEARAQFSSGTVSGVKAGCSAGCGGAPRGVIDASPPPPTSLQDRFSTHNHIYNH